MSNIATRVLETRLKDLRAELPGAANTAKDYEERARKSRLREADIKAAIADIERSIEQITAAERRRAIYGKEVVK